MERQKLNIKVKQPLKSLTINQKLGKEYLELIKDEVNVKEVFFGEETFLDTEITPELKHEGDFRELLRFIQSLRKDMDLKPEEKISLSLDTNEEGTKIVEKFEKDIQRIAGVSSIKFESGGDQELLLEDIFFKIKIKK